MKNKNKEKNSARKVICIFDYSVTLPKLFLNTDCKTRRWSTKVRMHEGKKHPYGN